MTDAKLHCYTCDANKTVIGKKSFTCASCSDLSGNRKWGVRPGTVGKKKGAAAGAEGGATGLFLLYKQKTINS